MSRRSVGLLPPQLPESPPTCARHAPGQGGRMGDRDRALAGPLYRRARLPGAARRARGALARARSARERGVPARAALARACRRQGERSLGSGCSQVKKTPSVRGNVLSRATWWRGTAGGRRSPVSSSGADGGRVASDRALESHRRAARRDRARAGRCQSRRSQSRRSSRARRRRPPQSSCRTRSRRQAGDDVSR